MTEHKFTDEEVIKAFDILNKFEFFGGQREGRELWFNKPTDIQNKDIGAFLRDLDFLRQFINRQKEEVAYWQDAAANARRETAMEILEKSIFISESPYRIHLIVEKKKFDELMIKYGVTDKNVGCNEEEMRVDEDA